MCRFPLPLTLFPQAHQNTVCSITPGHPPPLLTMIHGQPTLQEMKPVVKIADGMNFQEMGQIGGPMHSYPFPMSQNTMMYPGYFPNFQFPGPNQNQGNNPQMGQMSPEMANMFNVQYAAQLANGGLTLGENYAGCSPGVHRSKDESEFEPKLAKEDREKKYDQVSGRLCLLSGTRKYAVTIGEILRRINPPETLHASLVNSILRNAKAKDNGTLLRTNLLNYGIELPQGRRKTCKTTCFTAFCEGEAHQLGLDFGQLMKERGGADVLGRTYAERLLSQDVPLEKIKSEVEAVERFMKFISDLNPPDKQPEDLVYNTPQERAVMTLSLFTHGFSHVALNGVAQYFGDIAAEMKMYLHRRQEQHESLTQSMPQNMLPPGFFAHPGPIPHPGQHE